VHCRDRNKPVSSRERCSAEGVAWSSACARVANADMAAAAAPTAVCTKQRAHVQHSSVCSLVRKTSVQCTFSSTPRAAVTAAVAAAAAAVLLLPTHSR
jgi:hypothetical protein